MTRQGVEVRAKGRKGGKAKGPDRRGKLEATVLRSFPAVCLLAVGLVGFACGGEGAPERKAGSVLWVSSESRSLSSAELDRLRREGIGELFVEVASLEWDGTDPDLGSAAWYEPPERIPATLVIGGRWPGASVAGDEAAERLAPAVGELLAEAPGYLLEVVGVHLDLEGIREEDGGESLAEALETLRDEIDRPIRWSATVDASSPAAEPLAEASDFLVDFAYGERPRPEGPDHADAWSFQRAEDRVAALEAFGRPYLVGAVTLGWARIEEGEPITRTGLAQLAWDRNLEAGLGFTLEGGDRQTHRFEASGGTYLGGAAVRKRQTVSVTSTSSAHLAALREAIEGETGPGYRGMAIYRLGGLGEGLALAPESILHGLAGEAALPEPVVSVAGGRTGSGRWTIEAVLSETGGESTDLGFVDANRIEISLPEGAWIDTVEPGNFYRYELLRRGRDGTATPSLRNPDVVRLYAPFLPAEGRLRSGEIRIRHVGDYLPLEVSASFLAPYGREVATGPEVVEPSRARASEPPEE